MRIMIKTPNPTTTKIKMLTTATNYIRNMKISLRENEIPFGYARLTCITSNGKQYFNTQRMINSYEKEINLDIILYNGSHSGISTYTDGAYRKLMLTASSTDTLQTYKDDSGEWIQNTVGIRTTFKFAFYQDKTIIGTINNPIEKNAVSVFPNCSYYIGTYYENGVSYYNSIYNFYNFIEKTNGEITSNIVPVLRLSDSKPMAYDIVNKTFSSNLGSGEFGYTKLDGTTISPLT